MSNGKTTQGEVGSPASPSHYGAFDKFITSGFANDSEKRVSALLKARCRRREAASGGTVAPPNVDSGTQ